MHEFYQINSTSESFKIVMFIRKCCKLIWEVKYAVLPPEKETHYHEGGCLIVKPDNTNYK